MRGSARVHLKKNVFLCQSFLKVKNEYLDNCALIREHSYLDHRYMYHVGLGFIL